MENFVNCFSFWHSPHRQHSAISSGRLNELAVSWFVALELEPPISLTRVLKNVAIPLARDLVARHFSGSHRHQNYLAAAIFQARPDVRDLVVKATLVREVKSILFSRASRLSVSPPANNSFKQMARMCDDVVNLHVLGSSG